MASMEKLFVQIFERKKLIIEKAKQQAELFDQHLASKLLIDGIAPPPWLWIPRFHSQTANPEGSLHPCPQLFSYSAHLDKTMPDMDNNGQFPSGLFSEASALNKDLDAGDKSSNLPECPVNVPNMDLTPLPPVDQKAVIAEKCQNPDLSLARLQRSKSRQKAFELRNSAKSGRSRTNEKSKIGASAGERKDNAPALPQLDHVNEPLLVNPSGILDVVESSENCSKSKVSTNNSSRIKTINSGQKNGSVNIDGSFSSMKASIIHADSTTQHFNQKNRELESLDVTNIVGQSITVTEAKSGYYRNKEEGDDVFGGKTRRSGSCSQQSKSDGQLLELDGSSASGKVDCGSDLMQRDSTDKLKELAKSMDVANRSCGEKVDAEDNQGKRKGTYGYNRRITRSMNLCQHFSSGGDLSKPDGILDREDETCGRFMQHAGGSASENCPGWGKDYVGYLKIDGTEGHKASLPSGKELELHGQNGSEQPMMGNSALSSTVRCADPETVESNVSYPNLTLCRFSSSNQSADLHATRMYSENSQETKDDLERCKAANSRDYSAKENIVFGHAGRSLTAEYANSSERILKPINSHEISGHGVVLSRSAASKKPSCLKLNRSGGSGLVELLSHSRRQPLTDAMDTNDPSKCSSEANAEALVDHERPADARSISLRSRLKDSNLRIGVEVALSGSYSDHIKSIKPKQLDFDNEEVLSLNETSSPSPSSEVHEKQSQEALASLDAADRCDDATAGAYHGKRHSIFNMPLAENSEDFTAEDGNQKGLSQAHISRVAADSALSAKESPDCNGEVVACTVEKTHEDSRLEIYDKPIFQVSRENSAMSHRRDVVRTSVLCSNEVREKPLQEALTSLDAADSCDGATAGKHSVKCHSIFNMPPPENSEDFTAGDGNQKGPPQDHISPAPDSALSAKESHDFDEEAAAYTVEENHEDSRLEIYDKPMFQVSYDNSALSHLRDAVRTSVPSRNSYVLRGLTIENTAVLVSGSAGNMEQKKMMSDTSQAAVSSRKSASIGRDITFSEPARPFYFEKHWCAEGFITEDKDAMPDYKRRKIDGQLNKASFAEKVMTDEATQIHDMDFTSNDVAKKDNSFKANMESQHLLPSEENVLRLKKSNSPVKGMFPEGGGHLIKGSESSTILQLEEDEFSLERQCRNAHNTPVKDEIDVPLSSTLGEGTSGDSLHLVKEEGVAVQTRSLFNTGRQWTPDSQIALDHKDEQELRNGERLNSGTRMMQEKCSYQEENGNFSNISVVSPQIQQLHLTCADEAIPVFERFLLQSDDEQSCIAGEKMSLEKLDLPSSTIDRASILEQLCKSACMDTPLSCSSHAYGLHEVTNLYQSLPCGLIEGKDSMSSILLNDSSEQCKGSGSCLGEGVDLFSDGPNSNRHSVQGKHYLSPVGKLWDRITSKSASSGKRGSSNTELPCIQEENENMDEVVDRFPDRIGTEKVPNSTKRENSNILASISEAEMCVYRCSLESVGTEFSVAGTQNGIKEKFCDQTSRKRIHESKAKKDSSSLLGANGSKRTSESLRSQSSKPKLSGKSSLREAPAKDAKRNNIVSGISSFIPLVQQKQNAANLKGKKDIKVKALEAAEAAKRAAEKKENERKMKKEALKLERARMEQENLRQLELQKKKKEEEQKKKEAEMAAKKRQREEEARKEKERKRVRTEEARRPQREHDGKLCADKDDKGVKCQSKDQKAQQRNGCSDDKERMEEERGRDKIEKTLTTESSTMGTSTNTIKADAISRDSEPARDSGKEKVISCADNATQKLVTTERESYEISPYKHSDDEDDEEDDDDSDHISKRKFIPSWASKNCVLLAIASQQRVNPEIIFPPESFCCVEEAVPEKRR